MDIDENDEPVSNTMELDSLNEALQELLDGIQEDFYAVVDWASKIDPLRCISMHGITERYISGQKADAAGFVRRLLDDLGARISMQFGKFVDEACHQLERSERNVRPVGILHCIPRFAVLATRMEQYIQGHSRDLVDQAYTKIINAMFDNLERVAQSDPKNSDIILLENYANFQTSLYDLANTVTSLQKFYHRASESYDQACLRHVRMIISTQFEKLFQFDQKIENLLYTIIPGDIPFQLGASKMDLRKTLRASLNGIDKSIFTMQKRLQKSLNSDELLPSLWARCKKDFIDRYESFVKNVVKVYPTEPIPSVDDMKRNFANVANFS